MSTDNPASWTMLVFSTALFSKKPRMMYHTLFSHDVMAAMLVYSLQKNFDYFFCLGHQHGRCVYCILCLLGSRENQEGNDLSFNSFLK